MCWTFNDVLMPADSSCRFSKCSEQNVSSQMKKKSYTTTTRWRITNVLQIGNREPINHMIVRNIYEITFQDRENVKIGGCCCDVANPHRGGRNRQQVHSIMLNPVETTMTVKTQSGKSLANVTSFWNYLPRVYTCTKKLTQLVARDQGPNTSQCYMGIYTMRLNYPMRDL